MYPNNAVEHSINAAERSNNTVEAFDNPAEASDIAAEHPDESIYLIEICIRIQLNLERNLSGGGRSLKNYYRQTDNPRVIERKTPNKTENRL
ncbi:MAG: hypothetical protein WCJ95_15680 [Mariniphaga sp.]